MCSCKCPPPCPPLTDEERKNGIQSFTHKYLLQLFANDQFSDGPINLNAFRDLLEGDVKPSDSQQLDLEQEHPDPATARKWLELTHRARMVDQWNQSRDLESIKTKSSQYQRRLAKAMIRLPENSLVREQNPAWVQLEVYEAVKNGGRTIRLEDDRQTREYKELEEMRKSVRNLSSLTVEQMKYVLGEIERVLKDLRKEERN